MGTPGETRRHVILGLLAGAGSFAATAGMGLSRSDGLQAPGALPAGGVRFPQGVASGDPQPDGVVLWTRAVPAQGGLEPVPLMAQVSRFPDFRSLVVAAPLEATAASDHTVRLFVDGLDPGTEYFYRFVAGPSISAPLGRTFTAPHGDDPRPFRLASVSCQNYQAGTFAAYRRMLLEDEARPPEERLRLVLHLGDFIYETLFATPVDATERDPIAVRSVPPLPSGGGMTGLGAHARTLEDFRHLYRTYCMDPDLMAARARWPFVCTWDDHEFANDGWQSHDTYGQGGAPAQKQRLAANQAWFEYIPALLTGARGLGNVPAEAHDFRDTPVEDALVSAEDLPAEPNNRAAIESIRIYRSLSLGRHVDLIVSDTRAYRSDHPVPEALNPFFPGGRGGIPVTLVRTFDAGRTDNDGNPPDAVTILGRPVPNARRDSPPGTMLGETQKAWWKASMAASKASWRVWASSVPIMPLRFDFGSVDIGLGDAVLSSDSWEGYPGERLELTAFLREKNISNVITLSGDHHAALVGLVGADPDVPEPAVAAEFCTPGISSPSLFDLARRVPDERVRPLIWYRDLADTLDIGPHGPRDRVNLNTTLLYGIKAAAAAAFTNLPGLARLFRNPRQNPHLRFLDSAAYGYTVLCFTDGQVDAEQVIIAAPREESPDGGGQLRYRVSFRVRPSCEASEEAVSSIAEGGSSPKDAVQHSGLRMDGPFFDGLPPDPFRP